MKIKDELRKLNNKNKASEFLIYIAYIFFAVLVRALFRLFSVFHVKKNKIVFCNMKGKRYGDNPLYISDALLKKHKGLDIVWLLDKNVETEIPDGVRRIDYGLVNRVRELSSARVWVDSNMKDLGTLKRKNQLYIQTWHGSYGLKKIGFDLGKGMPLIDRLIYPYNAKITDYLVSNSTSTSNIYRKAFRYAGKLLEVGSPRNDIFLTDNVKHIVNRVDETYGSVGKKIVLYAPTWRKDFGIDNFDIDANKVLDALSKRFGGDWLYLVRLHPHNFLEINKIQYNDKVLNASYYANMQELLARADVLITDYSSCMFDFVTKIKPCFIYAKDIKQYEKEQGNYYSLASLPFPIAASDDELIDNIVNFNDDQYKQNVKKLHKQVGLCETGRASDFVADVIMEFINK